MFRNSERIRVGAEVMEIPDVITTVVPMDGAGSDGQDDW